MMNWKERDKHEQTQVAKLAALMPKLLELLPGWTLKPPSEEEDGRTWRQGVDEHCQPAPGAARRNCPQRLGQAQDPQRRRT